MKKKTINKGSIASKKLQIKSKTFRKKTEEEKAALSAKRKKIKEQREAEILIFRNQLKVLYRKVIKLEKETDAYRLYKKNFQQEKRR